MSEPKLSTLRIVDIIPSGDNPRIINEKSAGFIELVVSVRAMGVIVPVHVRDCPGRMEFKGKYELLAGDRRLQAAARAGWAEIPAVCHGQIGDEEAFEITFAENFARKDLTPLEQGKAVETLLVKYKGDAAAAASKMGKSVRWVLQRKAIHNNLSKQWRKAITEDPDYKDYTASHLQLIAALPQNIQDEILEDHGYGEVPTVKELEKTIADSMRLLSKAPWDLNDGGLIDKVKACSKCTKRSSSQPGLFDDTTDTETIKRNDRCLDAGCWRNKMTAHLQKRAEQLKTEYPNLIFAVMPDEKVDYYEKERLTGLWPDTVFEWKSAKENSKGALPALVVYGEKTGELCWIRPVATVDRRGQAKRLGKDGKPAKKPLKQRQAELKSKRWCAVLRGLVSKVQKVETEAIPDDEVQTVLMLAAVFGTIKNHQYNYRDDNLWDTFRKLSNADAHFKATDMLWGMVRPVLAQRLTYNDAITRVPEHYIDEAKQTSKLLGIDIEAMFAEQVKAIREPKSWAKEKSANKKKNKPKKSTKKAKKKTEIRTCRKCGCTNDKPCMTEEGPCHWVEPDLCSACVDKKTKSKSKKSVRTAKKKKD